GDGQPAGQRRPAHARGRLHRAPRPAHRGTGDGAGPGYGARNRSGGAREPLRSILAQAGRQATDRRPRSDDREGRDGGSRRRGDRGVTARPGRHLHPLVPGTGRRARARGIRVTAPRARGPMMAYPLPVTHFLERAAAYFGGTEVVSAGSDEVVRLCWRNVAARAARAAEALRTLGVGAGDRVATLAWNTHRHLELYFGVPAMGAVLHTVNLRLSERQVAEIVAHGGAQVLLADADQAAVTDVERLRAVGVEHFVALCGGGRAPRGWLAYEDLLADASPPAAWPELEEDLPAGL